MKNYSIGLLKLFLGIIFLGILIYNFHIANSLKYESEGDAANFIELGLSLAQTQKYGHIKGLEEGVITAFKNKNIQENQIEFANHSTWRPPVWPILIAGVFLLFGYNLTYVLIFKFLLQLLGIFIFYKTLKLLKVKKVLVLIGIFLYAVNPAWQLYSRVFLSEPITLFFLTLWLYLLIAYVKQKKAFFIQAIVAGILILSHPYYIFLPFTVWLILVINNQIRLNRFVISSVICAAVVSTWVIRNFIVLDTNQMIITTSSGAVMAKGWNHKVPNEHTNTKGDLADEELVLLDFEYNRNEFDGEVGSMQLYQDASLNFIRSNPDLIIPIVWKKIKSAFNPFPETSRPGFLETGRVIYQVLSFLSLIIILLFYKNKLQWSLGVALVISTMAITVLTYSGLRFRMPQTTLELLFFILVLQQVFNSKLNSEFKYFS
ncbi:dolichyl-phosphate-mannose-protein mannosyltransferase [Salegentibacter sp. 24]|uniref:glycosyltransferase family 39 protein n=1 Tax=Salegentibacter sp. 24 TaxID=2183986 RepID=UPI00105C9E90|nr:glycosyltransferase family 39 protein [Salegentibacter sp. 24]TDN89135.1 dolichyl-phosphate-mannose-protein mannosyltransferase [Salegentibacter sp. 24]